MRGKTARRLRRFARALVPQGSPEVRYQQLRPSTVFGPLIPGQSKKTTATFLGQLVMNRNCVRHAYQEAKKRFKKAPHTERVFPEGNR